MKPICHDLFNIAERLRNIDPDYVLCRDNTQNRFVVYWRGKLAFVVPFDRLDERTLVYAKKTRRENADELEREIDEGNAAIWQEQVKTIEKMKNQIKDYVLYDFERFN